MNSTPRSHVPGGRSVAVIDGVRTPFLRSGTEFRDLTAYDLGRMAIAGLIHRNALDPASLGLVVLGTVIQDPNTSNLAREAALAAGVPAAVPAFTVTAACISANVAFRDAARAVALGEVDAAIAGGAETLSDVPIRFRRPVRKRLIAAQKARGPLGWMKLLRGLRLADLAPDVPAIADFSTGLTMGQNAERLVKRLGITREVQDAYALESHRRAARAAEAGWFDDQILPARVPPTFSAIVRDNGVRGDSTPEKMAALQPAFDRTFGTVTAANSSYLTDGGSAVLLMSEERARALGVPVLARVLSEALVALEPLEELLVGPAVAIPKALERAGLALGDVDVVELHEAFAGQVLAVLALLDDAEFARTRLGRTAAAGTIAGARLNAWGGSLSIGHPFGATGGRLVTQCCRRLHRESGRFGLVAACASGGLGYAAVLERVEP